jgi:GNAT superfamily N-acetyltransferase
MHTTERSEAESFQTPPGDILLRPFESGDETAFRELNESWIRKYFAIEEKDSEVLNDPLTYILKPGGHILMAVHAGSPIGCCALLPMEGDCFEVAKMCVSEELRGAGIGRRLLYHVVEYARSIGARRLYLETNTKLTNAIHLYEAVGFRHVPVERVQPSPYARANVYMEMPLA